MIQKSCGCLHKETCVNNGKIVQKIPGLSISKTRIYKIWRSMLDRCYLDKHTYYKHYGGRGIIICDEWKNDVVNFYNWAINNGYQDNLTIDRKDNNGNYEPNNCKWSTIKEQHNNTSRNHYVTYLNKTQTVAQWSEELNINYRFLLKKINKGLTIEEIINKEKIIA